MKFKKTYATLKKLQAYLDVIGFNNDEIKNNISAAFEELKEAKTIENQALNTCHKCGNKTILMSGRIYLELDTEPYQSGKEEKTRTGIDEIDRHINAHFCETCGEIVNTFNE